MIRIDKTLCAGCGLCAADCLSRVIRISGGKAEITGACFECGHCVAICPEAAVRFEGDGYDMSDVESVGAGFGIDAETMLHAIRTRRSVRHFTDEKPDRSVLEQILEAGRFSPTASNAQNVSYMVFLEETEELSRIAMEELRSYRYDPEGFAAVFPPPMTTRRIDFDSDSFLFKGAPAVILTLSPHTVNAAIASASMELMAASLGLGALYVGFFTRLAEKNARLRSYLGLQDSDRVVTCLALGFPDVRYRRTVPRRKAKTVWR